MSINTSERVRMSPKETSTALRITTKTLKRWRDAGKIEADLGGPRMVYLVPKEWVGKPTASLANVVGDTYGKLVKMGDNLNLDQCKALAEMEKARAAVLIARRQQTEAGAVVDKALQELREELERMRDAIAKEKDELQSAWDVVKTKERTVSVLEKKLVEQKADARKVLLVKEWITATVVALVGSETWKKAYHEEGSNLPEWPEEVNIEEVQAWADLKVKAKKK